jgi:drug/metabolite transporter (DMT)-like permease
MIRNQLIKGSVLVGLGATSFGMLATFVKMAYAEGFTTAEVTIAQFILGILGVLLISLFKKNNRKEGSTKATPKIIFQLMTAGTSLGLTSVFYYMAVHYIPVSIAIVLLMQTVWIGLLLEMFLEKKAPSLQKIIAAVIVLFGTLLATNIFKDEIQLDWRGIVFGILAAFSFTTTMFTSNRVGLGLTNTQRSLYMLLGGAVIVFTFAFFTQNTPFNFSIFYKWGVIVALFGTIIPPMLMNAGFPLTGIGLGSILSALELPVSVLMAFSLLGEQVLLIQWIGILLILLAIIIMNIQFKKKKIH